jgi:hypothetical protein
MPTIAALLLTALAAYKKGDTTTLIESLRQAEDHYGDETVQFKLDNGFICLVERETGEGQSGPVRWTIYKGQHQTLVGFYESTLKMFERLVHMEKLKV